MKKLTLILIILILLIAGGFAIYYSFSLKLKPTVDIETVIPTGPVVYFRAINIEKKIEGFSQTKFWNQIKQIDVNSLLEEFEVEKQVVAQFNDFTKQIKEIKENKLLKELFGKEVAIAVYPSDIGNLSPEKVKEAASDLLLVAQLTPTTQFLDLMVSAMKNFAKDVSVE